MQGGIKLKVIDQAISKKYALYNGDSAEVMQFLQDNSMDYSIFSPPFEDLYTYSDSPRDLGIAGAQRNFISSSHSSLKNCIVL